MKIVTMILGILALVGGLAFIGLVASSNSGGVSKFLAEDAKIKAVEAEKKWEQSGDPKDKEEVDKWLKLEKETAKTLENKKTEKQFGFIFGGVLAVVGIGLFGLSFVFSRKKE